MLSRRWPAFTATCKVSPADHCRRSGAGGTAARCGAGERSCGITQKFYYGLAARSGPCRAPKFTDRNAGRRVSVANCRASPHVAIYRSPLAPAPVDQSAWPSARRWCRTGSGTSGGKDRADNHRRFQISGAIPGGKGDGMNRLALWPWRSEELVPQSMVTVRPSGFVEPCIPTRAAKPPASPGWVHEIKHDGYRLQVHRHGAAVRLFTGAATTGASDTRQSHRRHQVARGVTSYGRQRRRRLQTACVSSVNARRGVGRPVPPTCRPYRGSEP